MGDPFFPNSGVRGIDVKHYDLRLQWNPKTGGLRAVATLDIEATERLKSINLELGEFRINGVRLNGHPRRFTYTQQKLSVKPLSELAKSEKFTLEVRYQGVPKPVPYAYVGKTGWLYSPSGVTVLNEPTGAPSWFPANDHPSDKASFTFHVTVPSRFSVAANGTPQEPVRRGAQTTYTFTAEEPMTTYNATVNIGHFRVTRKRGPNGLSITNYYAKAFPKADAAHFDELPAIIRFLNGRFGPYPFDNAGVIVVNGDFPYALETQTRPVFSLITGASSQVGVHELAHQWFGNSVTPKRWKDIWVTEGFATYAEVLWLEHQKGKAFAETVLEAWYDGLQGIQNFGTPESFGELMAYLQLADESLEQPTALRALGLLAPSVAPIKRREAIAAAYRPGFKVSDLEPVLERLDVENVSLEFEAFSRYNALVSKTPYRSPNDIQLATLQAAPGNVTADTLFERNSYQRGALALHALRLMLGDNYFFSFLEDVTTRYAYSNVSVQDVIALAAEYNPEARPLLESWLFDTDVPALPELGLENTLAR